MLTLIPDRLSLKTIRRDYWRSLNRYGTRKRDVYATFVIFVVPAAVGAAAIWPVKLVITNPSALLPAVSLLAGVLLAAAGQVITLRARIADSLVLSSNERVTMYIRETISLDSRWRNCVEVVRRVGVSSGREGELEGSVVPPGDRGFGVGVAGIDEQGVVAA
jgi:hypothetical protein